MAVAKKKTADQFSADALRVLSRPNEADIVNGFVEGRKLVNEGTRKVNAAKRYFEDSTTNAWKSDEYIVTTEIKPRAGFDMEAFKAAHPKLYDKFYRSDMPSVSYTVIERT